MLSRNLRRSVASLGLALLLLLSGSQFATAATKSVSSAGSGLRVAPVRTDLTIKAGETQTVSVNVTNVTSQTATYQTVINDFIANPNETGEPALLVNPNQYASSHSLKRFVLPISPITVAAGQEVTVTVTIKVPANAAGGGYYGAVRFVPGSNSGGNVNLNLAGSVGSLILVKVPGDIVEKMTISSFDARVNDRPNSFFTSSHGINAVVRFQNEGNLQEQPFGKILLRSHSGKILASYEVNSDTPPGNVLPDSIRKFSIPLKKVGSIGEFKIEGNFGYGASGQLLSASTTFYVIPLWLIILFIVFVALVIFMIFGFPRLLRAYNQNVLRRAGRR